FPSPALPPRFIYSLSLHDALPIYPLSFYSSDDFDAVAEYICSDGRARLEEHLATEVRSFLGFEQRSVLLDVSVSSAIRRYQERQDRKSTRLNSSHVSISYAVFCLK